MNDKEQDDIIDIIMVERDTKRLYRIMQEIGEHLRQLGVMVMMDVKT